MIAARKKRRSRLTESRLGYLLILPNYIIYTVFTLIPIFWTVAMSFTDYDLKSYTFIGIQNYINIFKDEIFLKSIWNTIYYSILTILPTMVLALLLALLLNRKIPGRGFFRTLFYLPNILSMVAVSMAWSYLYNSQAGILNKMLNAIGLPSIGWVTDTKWAMISVAIMAIWQSLGYNAVLYCREFLPIYMKRQPLTVQILFSSFSMSQFRRFGRPPFLSLSCPVSIRLKCLVRCTSSPRADRSTRRLPLLTRFTAMALNTTRWVMLQPKRLFCWY